MKFRLFNLSKMTLKPIYVHQSTRRIIGVNFNKADTVTEHISLYSPDSTHIKHNPTDVKELNRQASVPMETGLSSSSNYATCSDHFDRSQQHLSSQQSNCSNNHQYSQLEFEDNSVFMEADTSQHVNTAEVAEWYNEDNCEAITNTFCTSVTQNEPENDRRDEAHGGSTNVLDSLDETLKNRVLKEMEAYSIAVRNLLSDQRKQFEECHAKKPDDLVNPGETFRICRNNEETSNSCTWCGAKQKRLPLRTDDIFSRKLSMIVEMFTLANKLTICLHCNKSGN